MVVGGNSVKKDETLYFVPSLISETVRDLSNLI